MATKERSFYKKACEDSKKTLEQVFTTDNVFTPPAPYSRIKPCTNDIVVHFSFDMAQQVSNVHIASVTSHATDVAPIFQVHYPYSPQQPGPIYFLTPRKCAIFGVCCEAIPRQINYFIDEAAATGKGANTIISLLHHFLETHNFGEAELHLHADNCSGQNKNRYIVEQRIDVHVHVCIYLLIQIHDAVSCMESDDWPQQENHTIFLDCWSHKILT